MQAYMENCSDAEERLVMLLALSEYLFTAFVDPTALYGIKWMGCNQMVNKPSDFNSNSHKLLNKISSAWMRQLKKSFPPCMVLFFLVSPNIIDSYLTLCLQQVSL